LGCCFVRFPSERGQLPESISVCRASETGNLEIANPNRRHLPRAGASRAGYPRPAAPRPSRPSRYRPRPVIAIIPCVALCGDVLGKDSVSVWRGIKDEYRITVSIHSLALKRGRLLRLEGPPSLSPGRQGMIPRNRRRPEGPRYSVRFHGPGATHRRLKAEPDSTDSATGPTNDERVSTTL
jgi:hypothetical protein